MMITKIRLYIYIYRYRCTYFYIYLFIHFQMSDLILVGLTQTCLNANTLLYFNEFVEISKKKKMHAFVCVCVCVGRGNKGGKGEGNRTKKRKGTLQPNEEILKASSTQDDQLDCSVTEASLKKHQSPFFSFLFGSFAHVERISVCFSRIPHRCHDLKKKKKKSRLPSLL